MKILAALSWIWGVHFTFMHGFSDSLLLRGASGTDFNKECVLSHELTWSSISYSRYHNTFLLVIAQDHASISLCLKKKSFLDAYIILVNVKCSHRKVVFRRAVYTGRTLWLTGQPPIPARDIVARHRVESV